VTRLSDTLLDITRELQREHPKFALVGGLAVSVRTEPRFTRDADFAVAVQNDHEAERVILSLRAVGYTVRTLVEQDAVGRLATVRLSRSDDRDSAIVDLLFASSGMSRKSLPEPSVSRCFRTSSCPWREPGISSP
jgi:nucleotidyltransferase AbiEii toxin of type IV toxin-antitoxin system